MSSASLSPFPWPSVSAIDTAGRCIIRPHQQDVGDPDPLHRRMQAALPSPILSCPSRPRGAALRLAPGRSGGCYRAALGARAEVWGGVAAGGGRWGPQEVRARGAGAKMPFVFPIRQGLLGFFGYLSNSLTPDLAGRIVPIVMRPSVAFPVVGCYNSHRSIPLSEGLTGGV